MTLAGEVEEEGDVVLGGDDQRVSLGGAGRGEELRPAVGAVKHAVVVGLPFLQGAVDEDTSHAEGGGAHAHLRDEAKVEALKSWQCFTMI